MLRQGCIISVQTELYKENVITRTEMLNIIDSYTRMSSKVKASPKKLQRSAETNTFSTTTKQCPRPAALNLTLNETWFETMIII